MRPAHTQALMSAAESRHRRRNPPSAAVPCRQPIRCQPSDLVLCCRAPSRHRHSPPRQRPILVARLRSLPQPFVPCRRVVAEGRSHPSANLAFPLLPSANILCFSRPSPFAGYLPLLCEPAFKYFLNNLSQTFIGIDVRATGLRSFMHEMTGFLGTGIVQEHFQMSGTKCVLNDKLKITVKISAN